MLKLIIISSCIILLNTFFLSYGDESSSSEEDNTPENFSYRIVGGRRSSISEYSYQVSISYAGEHMCGGSILTNYFIITAAHCTKDLELELMKIRAGSTYADRGGVLRSILYAVEHPSYDGDYFFHDISIICLSEALAFNENIIPVGIYYDLGYRIPEGTIANVSGWGLEDFMNEKGSNILKSVEVPIISLERCRLFYEDSPIEDDAICAGYDEGGMDSCVGDSGGPLVINRMQIGIVSWGKGCADAYSPGVYTYIPDVMYFIRAVTNTPGIPMRLNTFFG